MDTPQRSRNFWFGLTVVLSVLFAGLFYPVVRDTYDVGTSRLLTVLGLAVIWVVYFIRGRIFSRVFARKNDAAENGRQA